MTFTEQEIEVLEEDLAMTSQPKLRRRLEAILAIARGNPGETMEAIARKAGTSKATLYRWLRKYRQDGIASLLYINYGRSVGACIEADAEFQRRYGMQRRHLWDNVQQDMADALHGLEMERKWERLIRYPVHPA